jgi:DNA-binding NarL/FixJ family response regulator
LYHAARLAAPVQIDHERILMAQLFGRETSRMHALVLDDLMMRRAEVVSFLVPWASAFAMDVYEGGLSETSAGNISGQGCRMMLLSVGGVPFENSEALPRLSLLAQTVPDAPLVILSDRASNHDVAIAFEAGASGYIPAETPPEVALRALTFILNGGHFFPPTVLQLPPRLASRKLPPESSSNASSMVHLASAKRL